tara:strand:+ start:9486 stop:9704 length:219 start_codon:yes stop_codon:yes gene_type:complete
METYTFLRSLADSWFLLLMMVFFIGTIVWAFRPGTKRIHADAASVVFRNDDRPAGDTVKTASRGTGSRQGAK